MSSQSLELDRLDDYSRSVAARLFERFPAASENAWLEIEDGEEQPFLVVQWIPEDDRGMDLELSTYAGETTLSSRFWHEHSSLLEAPPRGDELDALLALLGGLLAGELRTAAIFRDGEWMRSRLIESQGQLDLLSSELGPRDWCWIRCHDGRRTLELGPGPRPEDL